MNKIRTAKSLKKPPPIVPKSNTQRDAENDIQFELELCWCVQQLENSLNTGKLNQKIAEETTKNLKTLKSGSAPLIKKRQVMKAAFGDYRSKMRDEENKLALASKQIKFTSNKDAKSKSSFVKKSAIITSGKDFKFNFSPESTTNNDVSSQSTNEITEPNLEKSSIINFVSDGETFKFNFIVDEENGCPDLNGLSIKN